MGRLAAAVVAVAFVSGCGGSAEPAATTAPTQSTADPERRPRVVDAIEDLSDFTCAPDDRGVWTASGVLTNTTRRVASYAVTVVVAESQAGGVRGKQRRLPASPGEPKQFTIRRIPVNGVDPACSVRVVRHR